MSWIIAALGVIFSSVVLYLAIRRSKDQALPLELRNLAMFALPAILMLVYNSARGISLAIEFIPLTIILLSGLFFSWLGNIASLKALELAPNPGFINAANSGSIALVTIFSALVFKDELNARKLIGVLGVLAGLGLLFI